MQQHSNFLTNTFDPWSNFQYLKCSGHHLTGGKGLPGPEIHFPSPKEGNVVTIAFDSLRRKKLENPPRHKCAN